MNREPHIPSSELWAVTTYFNPCGYRSRYRNYRAFRQNIQVPLLTVELCFGKVYELTAADATRLVQLRSDQVMWQKERLINLALQALPSQCRKVAWLDCDILFERSDWADEASRALDHFSLVQLFSQSHALNPAADLAMPLAAQRYLVQESLAAGYLNGETGLDMPSLSSGRQLVQGLPHSASPGLAWAMRKEDLSRVALYDALIVGGGDYAMALAALGRARAFADEYELSAVRRGHYLEWAERFRRIVDGNLGMVEGDIYHLWHGVLADRQYDSRHEILRRHEFDPYRDIALDHTGCWRWGSDKPELHSGVRAFFERRNENLC